ncbi:biotin--[acetyl-CoA-carboxylase] ligase [Hydrogenivirga sp.]
MHEYLIWLKEVESTQLFLREKELPCGSVVVADRQKRGKGRKGRRWESQEGGLYFSFVLCEEDFREYAQIPLVIGLALSNFLEELGIRTSIKWPNDVYVRGRKISGVLVEKSRNRIVVGVGINLNQSAFEGDIAQRATSVKLTLGKPVSKRDSLLKILKHIRLRLRGYREEGFVGLRDEIDRKLLFKGEEVIVLGDKPEVGILLGIDERGFLLLQTPEGTKPIMAGDLSLRLYR